MGGSTPLRSLVGFETKSPKYFFFIKEMSFFLGCIINRFITMQHAAKDRRKVHRHTILAAVPQAQETELCDLRIH